MKKVYLAVVLILFFGLSLQAQNDNGAIKIELKDKNTGESIPFANVVAYKDGVQIAVSTTNMDGEAVIKPLTPGKYTVKGIYVGYQAAEIKDVVVGEGKTAYITIPLSNGEGVKLDEVVIMEYKVPLIDPDTKTGQTVTREDYQNMATKDINSVAATSAGVYQADEGKGLNVRGGRDGNATYFVDGVKVFGKPNLPQQAIEQLQIITGGIPASYGDLTSGVISLTTRGPQSKFFGGVELISSQLTDKFGYNLLGFSLGGPIYKKHDSTRRTVLGYFVSGQGTYVKEPSPSFVPIYVLKDEKLQEIKDQPLLPSRSGTGFVRASEYVTKDDMTTQRFRPNASARQLSINGKIDFQPTDKTIIAIGGNYEYSDINNANSANNLFNADNNARSTLRSSRVNVAITQKFGSTGADKAKTQSLLTNSYFKFLVSYQNDFGKTESAQHKDKFFDYGYIGKFDRSFRDENYAYNYDIVQDYQLTQPDGSVLAVNAFTYHGRSELPVAFTPGDKNPDAAIYTSYLQSQTEPGKFTMSYIPGNYGLRNGDVVPSIYALYNNFGSGQYAYQKAVNNQFRIATSFNTDFKNHALSVGFEFDQRANAYYILYAQPLWTRMRLIMENANTQLDKSHPIRNPNLSGVIDYYYFDYLYQPDKQTQFSERLLEKIGLPKDYTGFVNTDGMDPSTFSLDMFSAQDLLGDVEANRMVFYSGFTHDNKRNTDKVNMTDFLEKKDDAGRNLFPVGTFKPIYSAAYIMDKFDFKDIKFLVGLRVDRYDANQPVLKDKYAVHELARISDLASLENLPAGFADHVPGNISKDAAVYVSQNPTGGKSPGSITGYRDGDKWYNSEGNEISDPNLLASSDGRPTPLFKDRADYGKKMSPGGFTNYVAAINPQPRLGFSFPISDVANFFAHYDWLVQRPGFSQIDPFDYYFLDGSANAPTINNPNQRPQQTIDYELGFSQVLNERKNASIKLTAFYKEFRNQINQRMIVGAYPKNYIMFDNIDFSTVKGMQFEFDFRRTGGSAIKLNYTLQFAEGSGSNANSGANLASSGQPNLRVLQPLDFDQRHSFVLSYDYRFGAKKDYKGPSFKTKKDKTVQIFEDIGFNLTCYMGSGTPYTRWSTAVPFNGGGRSSIAGQINGSSKPWTFRANLRVDKNIPLSWGSEESGNKKNANLNVYLQVLNVFNNSNIINVYNFTGAPNDDGYLTSTQGKNALGLANSAAAFTDMYSIRMNAPGNYSLPRQIRIGVLFEF
jgi:outer membrane receptor for ferrienterochelin and colicin